MPTITKYEGKKGTSYNVIIRKNHVIQRATFPTKKMAEDWAREKEHNIVLEKNFGIAPKREEHTCSELIQYYKEGMLPQKAPRTQADHGKILDWWYEVLHDTNVKHVNFMMLDRWKGILLRDRKYSNGRVNLYFNVLSPTFTLAIKSGWLTKNPVSEIERLKEKPRAPHLQDVQLNTLLAVCKQSESPHLYVFVRTILGTGARYKELLKARWNQIDWNKSTITFLLTFLANENRYLRIG